ncbi:MAG: ATP-dependent Clp protease ATP-binding subunit [Eubacteriales bacterium]
MTNRFSAAAGNALTNALAASRELGHAYIGTEHILLGLLGEKDAAAAKILSSKGILLSNVRTRLIEAAGIGTATDVKPSDMTPAAKSILEGAYAEAIKCGQSHIATEHLLYAILCQPDCMAAKLIVASGGSLSELRSELSAFLDGNFRVFTGAVKTPKKISLPYLDKYARDLTAAAAEPSADPVIGRESECERVIQILCRRRKNNPCLIGEAGVGKTAVVEGLASRIVEKKVPDLLRSKRIYALDLSSMIAGAKYRGEFEERMRGVLAEATANPEVILFLDEIHTIVGAGSAEGAIDAANILKPALARGQIQLIGATTLKEYRQIEKDSALERRFQSVMVEEPNEEAAIGILRGLKDRYEAHHKVEILDDAIRAAVRLSIRYLPERKLPDKAIDLIDEAASRIRVASGSMPDELLSLEEKTRDAASEKEDAIRNQNFELAARLRDKESEAQTELRLAKERYDREHSHNLPKVTERDIADVLTLWTGIPVLSAEKEEKERLLSMEKLLSEQVIGQEDAIRTLSLAIRRSRLGFANPNRPAGSFILMGPTGVGKTRLSQELAKLLFGSSDALIRLDMSEYSEKHSISKLIGSPPGYVGYDEGGQLTEKVRRHPYSVILFDEIEKAHRDLSGILLQILDEGQLTDSGGRRVDFRNTVILLTSNIGAAGISDEKHTPGFSAGELTREEKQNLAKEALRELFPPELLGRFDEIIVFRKLSDDDLIRIAKAMLEENRQRIESAGYPVVIEDGVAEQIISSETDRRYGARTIRKAIEGSVVNPLALEILEGRIGKGDPVRVCLREGKITISKG